jgi:RNA polymerase sigma factor (sigma-70 family)
LIVPFDAIYNERELLLQVAQGDRPAFQIIYTHYYPLVLQQISLFEPSKSSRDELAQDVFVRIWDKRVLLAGVESFKAYLFTMTRNLGLNRIKERRVRRSLSELGPSGEQEAAEDTEKYLESKRLNQLLLEALRKMPKGMSQVLRMDIEKGLSTDEIAIQLRVSQAAVKKQLVKAKAFVRKYLRDKGELSILLIAFISLFEH